MFVAPSVRGKTSADAFYRHIEMESRARQRYPYVMDETCNVPIEMHSLAGDRTFNMPIEMERRRQIRPVTPSGSGQGTYNEQFDMRFWNGE